MANQNRYPSNQRQEMPAGEYVFPPAEDPRCRTPLNQPDDDPTALPPE